MLLNSRKSAKFVRLTQSLLLAALAAVFTLAATPGSAFAQSATTGAIGGTVTDSGGALLPATSITVTAVETGIARTVKSNASGEFRVTDLAPGTYTAIFTADGFGTYKEISITVSVGSISTVSPSLKVGSVTDTVEVTDETPLMHTQDDAISTTIDQNAIDNLPINGRRWSNFALLTPGVVSNGDGFGLLSFRGISVLLNNSTVDGADNNQAYFSEERGRTRASYSVSQSAVQEFQVNASNYSAEYGRAAGGVINTVTRSGSNKLHGELFFYDRDNEFGARNPYTTVTTQVVGSNNFITTPYKPKDWRKQWGFGAGGPLLHDKLFWFYSYDQSQRNFPGTARASDPADSFAAADTTLPAGSSCSTGTLSTGDSGACGVAGAIYGTGNATINYQAGAAYYTQGLGILASFLGPVPRHSDQVLNFPKLDWQIDEANRLTVQYNRLRFSAPAGVQTQASNFYGKSSFGNDFVKEDFGIVRLSTVLSSNKVNNFLFQYGRDFEYESSQTPSPNEQPLSQKIGGDPLAPAAPPDANIGYEFDGTGFDIGRVYFLERRALPNERRLQGEDSISWSHGQHVIKTGVEVNRVFDFVDNLYQEGGSYGYDYSWDFIADYLHATTGLGNAQSGGYAQQYYSFSQGFGNPRGELATTDYAGFITDDWRVTPRLTVTLGARYEYEYIPPPFSPNTNGTGLSGPSVVAGGPVPQTSYKPDDRNNIGPRVGFAYNVYGDGKTTLRGGYGMYYGRIINSNIIQSYLLSGSPNGQVDYEPSAGLTGNRCATFPTIFSSAAAFTSACVNGGTNGPVYTSTIAYLDKHLQNPQIHEVDLALEQSLGGNTTLSLSYMGSFGRELAAAVDQNVSPATGTRTFEVANNTNLPTPGYTTYPHGGKAPPLAANSLHTYKEYLTGNTPGNFANYYHVLAFKSEVNSSYHALAVSVNHRYSDNFSLLSNFTWAHALDYNPYLSTGYGTSASLLDPLNPSGDYATSSLNVRHRFVAAATYTTNINGLKGWEKEAANGWRIAPIVQMQNGLPYSPGLSGSVSGSLYGGILGAGGTSRIPDLGRNIYTMPNTAAVDVRLSKSFALTRGESRYRFEIIGEAFNLFNHQNITSVDTNAYCIASGVTVGGGAPSTGVACKNIQAAPTKYANITPDYYVANPLFGTNLNSNSTTLQTPRQLQLAGRLYF